jgi:hypothetical protein
MVVMIAVDAVAPVGRPMAALEQSLERGRQITPVLANPDAAIPQNRQAIVVWNPTVGAKLNASALSAKSTGND